MNTDKQTEAEQLLKAGIASAKAGQRVPARALLRRVTEMDPHQALAWLWLSGLVENLEERVTYLERALEIDPDNDQARQALEKFRPELVESWLRQGIADAEIGRQERARELLMKVLEHDEENIEAWFWLGKALDDLEEREICFENVLTLNPNYTEAQEELEHIQKMRDGQEPRRYATLASEILGSRMDDRDIIEEITAGVETTEEAPTKAPVSAAAAILGKTFDSLYGQADDEEIAPPTSQDPFDNVYLCPYCATVTQPEDRACAACGNPLWRKKRRRVQENRADRFQLLLMGEVGVVLISAALTWFWLLSVSIQTKLAIRDIFAIYIGQAGSPTPLIDYASQILPSWVFWCSFIPIIAAMLTLLGVYFHRPSVFFVLQGADIVRLLIAAGLLIFVFGRGLGSFSPDIPRDLPIQEQVTLAVQSTLSKIINLLLLFGSLINLVTAIILLFLLRSLVDAYLVDEERIILAVDKDVRSNEVGLRTRGLFYYKQHMWALATLHLRRASAINYGDSGLFLSLTAAYIKLNRYDLAEDSLNSARQLNSDMPEVEEMTILLEEQKAKHK